MEMDNSSSGRLKSQNIVGAKLVPTTREQYAKTAIFITNYCIRNIPDAVDEDDRLILPIQLNVLETFMGDMAEDKEDGECNIF